REVYNHAHGPIILALKCQAVLAVDGAVEKGANLAPFFELAIEVLESPDLQGTVGLRHYLYFSEWVLHSKEIAFRAAAGDVITRHGAGVGRCVSRLRRLRRSVGKIAIEEMEP